MTHVPIDALMASIADDVAAWTAVLEESAAAPNDKRERVLDAFRAVCEKAPGPLCDAAHEPGDGETAPKAALHYRIANEILRAFPAPDARGPATSRGMLLDLWDIWWEGAAGSNPGMVATRPPETLEPSDRSRRRVVEPDLVLDALCGCNRDVAALLSSGSGGQAALIAQIMWQMRRLHLTAEPFDLADRAILYELLFMRHLRYADADAGFLPETLGVLFDAVMRTRAALANEGASVPLAPEAAFAKGEAASEDERTLAMAAMQFAASAHLAGYGLEAAVAQAAQAGPDLLDQKADAWLAADLSALLRRLAARSRMLRIGVGDLIGYAFPQRQQSAPTAQVADSDCDCWISVVGHRMTGKTYFMSSLTAALLPDGTSLDKQGGDPASLWNKGRVRLLETGEFSRAPDRSTVNANAFTSKEILSILETWRAGEDTDRTGESFAHMAEIDTPYMARLKFFDLAGEQIVRQDARDLGNEVREVLEATRPAAAIIVDSDSDATNARYEDGGQYEAFAGLIADENAPVYIVINKYDMIIENGGYSEEAQEELRLSMAYSFPQEPADADQGSGWIPFLSTRDIGVDTESPTHLTLLDHIETAPQYVKRPYYQARLRHDIQRMGTMIDQLFRAGRRDISILYLVAARNGRDRPEAFTGHRLLWHDLESRVLQDTREARHRRIRGLLLDDPVRHEHAAANHYRAFDGAFGKPLEALRRLGEPNAPAPSSPTKLDAAGIRIWNHLYDNLPVVFEDGPETDVAKERIKEAQGLRKAWCRITGGLKARQELTGAMETVLLGLLPELGIDPQGDFRRHDLDQARTPLEAAWDRLSMDEVTSVLEEALRNKGAFHDSVGEKLKPLVRSIVQGFTDDGASLPGHSPAALAYTLRRGTERPLGIAGAPAQDNRLTLAERNALHLSYGKFGDAILDRRREPQVAAALSRALHNISPEVPYPHLVLEPGERDFHLARVLTEASQLGDDLRAFREAGFGVIAQVLQARARLNNVEDAVVANLAMTRAVREALSAQNIETVEALIAADDLEETRLSKRLKQAKSLQDMLLEIANEGRELLSFWKDFADRVQNAREKVGIAENWRDILPETAPLAEKVWRRKNLSSNELATLRDALAMINSRVVLLDTLKKGIISLRDTEAEEVQRAKEFLREPLLCIREGDTGRFAPLSHLRPRLIRLRLMRRQLLLGYGLRMVQMGAWFDPANVEDSGNAQLLGDIQRTVGDALQSLHDSFLNLEQAGAQVLDGPSIGVPENDAFAISDAGSINDKRYSALLGLLGFDGSGDSEDDLWGPKR